MIQCVRRLMTLLTVVVLVLPYGAFTVARAATTDDTPERFDLAAMMLTPGDLEQAGLGGASQYLEIEVGTPNVFVQEAHRQGRDRDLADFLNSVGWVQQHVALLQADNGSEVGIVLIRMAGPSDARRVFDERAGVAGILLNDYEPGDRFDTVPDSTIGDESETVRVVRGTVAAPRHVAIDTTFRSGAWVASVAILRGAPDDSVTVMARVELVERLATRLLSRIDAVEGARDLLGTLVLRIDPVPADTFENSFSFEGYRRFAGETLTTPGEGSNPEEGPYEQYDRFAISDALQSISDVSETDTWSPVSFAQVGIELVRLADAQHADAYLDAIVEHQSAGRANGPQYEVLSDAERFGDESVTMLRADPIASDVVGPVTEYVIVARVDAYVVVVFVFPSESPRIIPLRGVVDSPAAAGMIMAAQLACLEAGACLEPLTFPVESVIDRHIVPRRTDPPAPGAGESAATPALDPGVVGTTYVSPTYGFSLDWDPAFWDVLGAHTAPSEDGLALTNGSSDVYIRGRASDIGVRRCVEEMAESLRGNGEIDVEIVEPLREEGRLAEVTYRNDPSVVDRPFLATVRCESFDQGRSMVAVIHLFPEDAAVTERPLLDDLLDTFDLPA